MLWALGGAGVDDGFAFEPPPLPWRRVAVEGVDEPVELLVCSSRDVGGAGGELLEHDMRDVGHLGDPVLDLPPLDPEVGRELGRRVAW